MNHRTHLHLYAEQPRAAWEEADRALRPHMRRSSPARHAIALAGVMVYVRSARQPERLLGLQPDTYSLADGCVVPDELRPRLARARLTPLAELPSYLAPDAPASDPDGPGLSDGD